MQMLAASGDEVAKIELGVSGAAGGIEAPQANDVAIAMSSAKTATRCNGRGILKQR